MLSHKFLRSIFVVGDRFAFAVLNVYDIGLLGIRHTLFIWSFAALFSERARSRGAILMGIVMIATAAADYTENVGMFRALRMGPSDWISLQMRGIS